MSIFSSLLKHSIGFMLLLTLYNFWRWSCFLFFRAEIAHLKDEILELIFFSHIQAWLLKWTVSFRKVSSCHCIWEVTVPKSITAPCLRVRAHFVFSVFNGNGISHHITFVDGRCLFSTITQMIYFPPSLKSIFSIPLDGTLNNIVLFHQSEIYIYF